MVCGDEGRMGEPGRWCRISGMDLSFTGVTNFEGVANLLIKAVVDAGILLRFADEIVILASALNGEIDNVFTLSLMGRSLRNCRGVVIGVGDSASSSSGDDKSGLLLALDFARLEIVESRGDEVEGLFRRRKLFFCRDRLVGWSLTDGDAAGLPQAFALFMPVLCAIRGE